MWPYHYNFFRFTVLKHLSFRYASYKREVSNCSSEQNSKSFFCMYRRSLAFSSVTDVYFISARSLLPLYSSGIAVEKRAVLVLVIFD